MGVRIPPMSKARARKIKLILFDVDGVLTDGKIWIFPAPAGAQQSILEQSAQHGGQGGFGLHSQTMIEAKGFNAHDGAAFSFARLGGLKTGLITKRISETVALRARDLKLEHVHQGIQDKLTCFEEILKQENLKASEAAFVGDDVIDLPVMRNCGFAIAVANARREVKAEAHFVTEHSGGDGAARDAIEYILKAQGSWKRVVSEYIFERSPKRTSEKKTPNQASAGKERRPKKASTREERSPKKAVAGEPRRPKRASASEDTKI
jgi:3-deoxy-D-manno-octulosonate 8-phosphate phosphatase (KDO 8-P phosphatase)